jgi:integrase
MRFFLTAWAAGATRPLPPERRPETVTAFERPGLGDEDLHFHDLRGTAVMRLALSGRPVPQIAAVTGHSLRDVEAILDGHYLSGDIE